MSVYPKPEGSFVNDPETCPHDDWEHEGEIYCTLCGKDMRPEGWESPDMM